MFAALFLSYQTWVDRLPSFIVLQVLREKAKVVREKRRIAQDQARIAQQEEARIQKALEDAAQAGAEAEEAEATIIPPPEQ